MRKMQGDRELSPFLLRSIILNEYELHGERIPYYARTR